MKTVYLHIGNFKTGTSAIQKYCSDHRDELMSAGVNYLRSGRPSSNRTNHGLLPLSLYRKYDAFVPEWFSGRVSYDRLAETVEAEIASSTASVILLSSEEFYRLPSYRNEVRQHAKEELKQLFSGCAVKVIIYVREPLDFLKSWYNQVNKSALPTARFIDFFFYLNKALLLPQVNAVFWRECFGDDCLIVQPYQSEEEGHIPEFLRLVGLTGIETGPSVRKVVNPGRDESTLERDRISKIMALPSGDERRKYLRSGVFSSMTSFNKLRAMIQQVNEQFDAWCSREGLEGMRSKLHLGPMLVHEERVNPKAYDVGSGPSSTLRSFLHHAFTRDAKRMFKKILRR